MRDPGALRRDLGALRPGPWAFAGVLAGAAAGILLVAFVQWQSGLLLLGADLLLAAGLRIALADDSVGLLRVRTKAFDALLLLVVGVALIALAVSLGHSS
ncbi:MAG TPA: DUF3017 domain-containing protein [Mycobacteriales bacterium]|jgi:hypothetical protein|nr:DUF3017 domain-containing protein [Mycobacteriales bacterium]